MSNVPDNGGALVTVHPDTLVVGKVNEDLFQQQNEVTSLVLHQIETTRTSKALEP